MKITNVIQITPYKTTKLEKKVKRVRRFANKNDH